ncbi:MAG: hypothetical protein JST85_11755 [Acidobacteria bacterium]|nr:hypothetical protein [Acidobacteriota bacterium]
MKTPRICIFTSTSLLFFVLTLVIPPMGMAQGQGRMGGMGMGGNQPQDMKTIHSLFSDHQKITRTVKPISNGVETITESDDPKIKALIVEHAWAMKARLEKKQPIRQWDPLFAELFKQADKINLEITNTEKGVKITETSTDPYVVKLIQAHAAGVSEFVREGMSVMHKEHPLPGETKEEGAFLGKGDGIETCPVTGAPVNKEIKYGFFGRTVYFCCESCLEAAKKTPGKFIKP